MCECTGNSRVGSQQMKQISSGAICDAGLGSLLVVGMASSVAHQRWIPQLLPGVLCQSNCGDAARLTDENAGRWVA